MRMSKTARTHITTKDLKAAMARRWCAPHDALIWEIGDATGGRHSRSADAVIMGLWPSRGILLEGVEIKTHRSDWLRELKTPAKAEPVARFCDRWWIHATPDVVRTEELPTGWGLRVFDGRVWTTPVEAAPRTPEPISREFLASLLRRSDQQIEKQATEHAQALLEPERAMMEQRIEAAVQQRTRRAAGMASVAEEFKAALGLDPEELIRNGEVAIAARMVAALLRQDLHNPWGGMSWLVKTLRDVADRTADAMEEIGIEVPPPEDRLARSVRSKSPKS